MHVDAHFLTGAKVFVPCNEPPPPAGFASSASSHSAASAADPSQSPAPAPSGVPEQSGRGTEGSLHAGGGEERTDDIVVHIILLYGPREGRWGRQPGIAAVAHG